MPVVVQRKVPMIQRVQKTVEVPQIQYVDKVVEAPVELAQQSVPVEAESWVEDVSVGTQTVSRKRKLSMETESAESADGMSDVEPGGVDETSVQGPEPGGVDETGVQGPEDKLVHVAPNMGAGGSHPQATWNQEWAEDLREIRRMVEFLVQRERKLDVKADVAIRRLERLEKENLQLEDEALEAGLPEALADKTKVVKLLVDKWFVDKGFGFGKVPSGEVVFIHASAVQGAEVLMIGTEAWVQEVNDYARAQGGSEHAEPGKKPRGSRRETGSGQAERQSVPDEQRRSRQSWRPTLKEQCPRRAPILRACFTTSQLQSAASRRQPLTAPSLSEATLSSGRSSQVPRPRGARARSIARNVDAKLLVDEVLDFYVKATGEDGVQMRQKLANMKAAALQQCRERWQKRAEEVQRFQDMKEEAWSLFRRQGGLGRKTKDDFETELRREITSILDRSSKEAEESRRMKQEDFRSRKLRSGGR